MPGNMKIQTTQGSFPAKSSKCLPNITFSTSFSKSFFQKNCRVPYLRYIKFSFLTTFMFSHPLSLPKNPPRPDLFAQSTQTPQQGHALMGTTVNTHRSAVKCLEDLESGVSWLLSILCCHCLLALPCLSAVCTCDPVHFPQEFFVQNSRQTTAL